MSYVQRKSFQSKYALKSMYHVACFLVQSAAVLLNLLMSDLYIFPASGNNGSSGFGFVSSAVIDSNTEIEK